MKLSVVGAMHGECAQQPPQAPGPFGLLHEEDTGSIHIHTVYTYIYI